MTANIFSCIFIGTAGLFSGYMILKTKFPGKGLKVIANIFKETIPFETAIRALKEGKRIRRKSKHKGYTKVIISVGKTQTEKFRSYWVDDNKDVDDYCSFSMDDILADDWIIEE